MIDELEPFKECAKRGSHLFRVNRFGVVMYDHPVDKGRFIESGIPASDHESRAWKCGSVAKAVNECAGNYVLLYWIDAATYAREKCLRGGCGFEELDHAQRMVRLARIFLERHGEKS